MHPRTRATIVWAKVELQRVAAECRSADGDEIERLIASLNGIDTTLLAVSRAIDSFGRQALLPFDVSSTPRPSR